MIYIRKNIKLATQLYLELIETDPNNALAHPFNRLCNTLSNAVKKRKLSQFSFETASFYD
jgi:hypothetical protein